MAAIIGNWVNTLRNYLGDPSNGGRWTNLQLLDFITEGALNVIKEVLWPVSLFSTTTIPGQGLYQLPELVQYSRVYVNGQPCPRVSEESMEGVQLGIYDQTAPGYVPQWTVAVPSAYPVANAQLGGPFPSGMPYIQSQRPVHFLRGMFLGLVPVPSNNPGVSLQFFGVPMPPEFATLQDQWNIPRSYKQAVVWDAFVQAWIGDKDGAGQVQTGLGMRKEKIDALLDWKREQTTDDDEGVIFPTTRGSFQIQNVIGVSAGGAFS